MKNIDYFGKFTQLITEWTPYLLPQQFREASATTSTRRITTRWSRVGGT